jgi:hypothetical protein
MGGIRFDISGPGLLRATQEAVEVKKQIVIAYDQDASGMLLRVGYFLEDKGSQNSNPTIIWFKKDEIVVKPIAVDNIPNDFKARFEINFLHPRKEEKHFLLDFPIGAEQQVLLRCLFRLRKNLVSDFVIQVEIKGIVNGKEKWRPAIRYDCAHDFIHRDLIFLNGKKTKKKLPVQTPKEAVIFAIDEIGKKLSQWLPQLGYKAVDPHILGHPLVAEDLEQAKIKLLALIENPQAMANSTESRLVLVR